MKSTLNAAVGIESATSQDLPILTTNESSTVIASNFEMGYCMPSTRNDVRRLLQIQSDIGFADLSSVDDSVLNRVMASSSGKKVTIYLPPPTYNLKH